MFRRYIGYIYVKMECFLLQYCRVLMCRAFLHEFSARDIWMYFFALIHIKLFDS